MRTTVMKVLAGLLFCTLTACATEPAHISLKPELSLPTFFMNTSAATADLLLRQADGLRARPLDPRGTAGVRLWASRLRAPVSRHGLAISRRTVMNNAG